jgi:hypothetical protein
MAQLDEGEVLEICADCGQAVREGERRYDVSDESVICFECAMRRGGAYDEAEDRWTSAPDADDLLERDRPN